VLSTGPQPIVDLTTSIAEDVVGAPSLQEGAPQTPFTPASTEALTSLEDLIITQDAHALDEKSKQSLQRHLLQLSKAAQRSFAKGALQQNHIWFLL
jgi:hypothetical protein